jgi:hypothetical protein
MQFFNKLGAEVEQIWRDKNYNEEAFPEICADALAAAELPTKLTCWEVVNWALGEVALPDQKDLPAKFGDPPITIYNSPRFHIDVYFWLDGTTEIHQHGFCGAFQVLHGSSIHSEYKFDLGEKINTFTELGDISLAKAEQLKVGDIRLILPGREFIHALFHLDRPSATIVIRTHKSPMFLPQFSYQKPALAIDPFFEEANTVKKLQSISMLLRVNHPDAEKQIEEMLDRADLQTSYIILSSVKHHLSASEIHQMFNISTTEDRFARLLDLVIKRQGETARAFPDIFREQGRIVDIIRRRQFIADPDHRYFLALLLNVPGKERIFSLIKERYPESDPLDKTLDWTMELGETRVLGLNLPNALGIEGFDDFDLLAFECLLKDMSDDEARKFVSETFGATQAEQIMPTMPERQAKLRNSNLLRALWMEN